MNLEVRQAQPGDVPAINAIRRACSDEITARLGEGHWTLSPAMTGPEAFLSLRDRYVLLVAEEMVGWFVARTGAPPFWPQEIWAEPAAPALCVVGIEVAPQVQRKGIGSWAMAVIEAMARQQGIEFVRLDAYKQNPRSVAFYRRLRYAERGVISVGELELVCFEKEVRMAG